jgi:hypothetical protein
MVVDITLLSKFFIGVCSEGEVAIITDWLCWRENIERYYLFLEEWENHQLNTIEDGCHGDGDEHSSD